MQSTRRNFLKFLGIAAVKIPTCTSLISLQSCSSNSKLPSFEDDVVLTEGLSYYPIISWGDKINQKEVFGFNNDYIDTHQLSANKLIMWVNHEYAHPLFVSGIERTKEHVDIERSQVGGSLIQVDYDGSKWKFNSKSEFNRGVRGDTPIPFANDIKVLDSNTAIGTIANCAGGKTPWNTFLTCEENYDNNYGERDPNTGQVTKSRLSWEKFYPHPPEHYGWVVEIEPKTGASKKHINLGRFAHECATCIISKENKVCVYTGDDKNDEFIYKFISSSHNNFDNGVLYAADTKNGKWLPLDLELSPILKTHFKDHVDLMINSRKAAKILGATPQNRPEDIEIHPETGDVYVALTNNKPKGDFHGQILKISEKDNNHSSLEFKSEVFVMGGELAAISCPDNLVFDKNGNLWVTTDISGKAIGNETYKKFGNNGLFVIPTKGPNIGQVIQVASAPIEAEFTGPKFSPDQQTLFLSVQHPGEKTKDLSKPTSNWPTGHLPKPTVIAITGEFLKKLTT